MIIQSYQLKIHSVRTIGILGLNSLNVKDTEYKLLEMICMLPIQNGSLTE